VQSPCGRDELSIMRKKMEGLSHIFSLNHGKYFDSDIEVFTSSYCAMNWGRGRG